MSIIFHSPQTLLLQFRSTPLQYTKGHGGYSGAPARPRHPRPRISMTSEIIGSKSKILLPFHGWLHLCTPSEKWWRKTEKPFAISQGHDNLQPQLSKGIQRGGGQWFSEFHDFFISGRREKNPWSWSVIEHSPQPICHDSISLQSWTTKLSSSNIAYIYLLSPYFLGGGRDFHSKAISEYI